MTFDSVTSGSGNLSWRNVKKELNDDDMDCEEGEDEAIEVEYEEDFEYEEEEIVEEEVIDDDESEYEEEEIILEEEVTETEVEDIGDIEEPGVEEVPLAVESDAKSLDQEADDAQESKEVDGKHEGVSEEDNNDEPERQSGEEVKEEVAMDEAAPSIETTVKEDDSAPEQSKIQDAEPAVALLEEIPIGEATEEKQSIVKKDVEEVEDEVPPTKQESEPESATTETPDDVPIEISTDGKPKEMKPLEEDVDSIAKEAPNTETTAAGPTIEEDESHSTSEAEEAAAPTEDADEIGASVEEEEEEKEDGNHTCDDRSVVANTASASLEIEPQDEAVVKNDENVPSASGEVSEANDSNSETSKDCEKHVTQKIELPKANVAEADNEANKKIGWEKPDWAKNSPLKAKKGTVAITPISPDEKNLGWEKPSWTKAKLKSTGKDLKKGIDLQAPITHVNSRKDPNKDLNVQANPDKILKATGKELKKGVDLQAPITHVNAEKERMDDINFEANPLILKPTDKGTAVRLGENLARPITYINSNGAPPSKESTQQ